MHGHILPRTTGSALVPSSSLTGSVRGRTSRFCTFACRSFPQVTYQCFSSRRTTPSEMVTLPRTSFAPGPTIAVAAGPRRLQHRHSRSVVAASCNWRLTSVPRLLTNFFATYPGQLTNPLDRVAGRLFYPRIILVGFDDAHHRAPHRRSWREAMEGPCAGRTASRGVGVVNSRLCMR